MYIKLPMGCFRMALGLYNFDGQIHYSGHWEGVGTKNLNFFGPKRHLLCSLSLRGPKSFLTIFLHARMGENLISNKKKKVRDRNSDAAFTTIL
jgi:hypothetical protein